VDPLLSPSFRRVLRAVVVAAAAALPCSMAAAQPTAPVVLILGDSISAGYGLPAGAGWVALLEKRLSAEHLPQRVVNASISGDTTAGGRERIEPLLKQHRPAVTVIELGGNDGLRGGNLDVMRDNLYGIVAAAQKAQSRVLLVGIRLPPNYGPEYVQRFAAIFGEVAKTRKTALVPFLFEGFGENNAMFQPDGIHPLGAAQQKMLDNVWRELKPLLGAPKDRK
jgi:acyl-CoA thioesterase-1